MTPKLLWFALPLCLLGPAQGAEPAPGWREALDQARGRLAASTGISASAFADVQSAYDEAGHRDVVFGAAELDLSGDLTQDLQAAAALVRFADLNKLTVGFLDYHPFGGGLAPRGQLWVEEGFHVQVGRFDVPFGSDYQFFASKDSVSISRPLTTDAVMDGGYNDAGLRILGNNGTVNFNAFLLQGFHPGRLLGGRIGLTPFGDPFSLKGTRQPKVAELGFSFFYDGDSHWHKRETGLAVDLDGRRGAYYARAEYLVRTLQPEPGQEGLSTRRGWHLTQEYGLGEALPWPATVFARLERVTVSEPLALSRDTRLAAGFSATLAGILQVKLEGQHALAASPGTRATPGHAGTLQWFAQLVAVF